MGLRSFHVTVHRVSAVYEDDVEVDEDLIGFEDERLAGESPRLAAWSKLNS